MGAAWLKNYLAPIRFLVAGIAQIRDDRVNFRNGFTASQVLDADGLPVLTIDNSAANTSYEPTANTIPVRNGSGTLKGNTITATSFTYVTPKEFTFREPIRVIRASLVAPGSWILTPLLELESDTNGSLQWQTELSLVPGSSIVSVSVVYTPSGGHVGLPADQPYIQLFKWQYGSAPVLVDNLQDAAVDVVDYEMQRTLTLTLASPEVVDPDTRYLIEFGSETGANALSGLTLHAPAIWTVEVSTP